MKNEKTTLLVVAALVIATLSGCGSKADQSATLTPQQAEQLKAQQIEKYKKIQEQAKTGKPLTQPMQ